MYIQGKLKKHLLKVAGALPFCKQSLILFSLLLILFSIFQLIHELDKNVYIVNPERFKLCGMSKSAGLLVLGLFLVGIQGKYSSCLQYFFFHYFIDVFFVCFSNSTRFLDGSPPPKGFVYNIGAFRVRSPDTRRRSLSNGIWLPSITWPHNLCPIR